MKIRSHLARHSLEMLKSLMLIQEKRSHSEAVSPIHPTPCSFSSAILPDPRVTTTFMLWRRHCLNSNSMGARSFSWQMGLGKMGSFGERKIRQFHFLPTVIRSGRCTGSSDCEGFSPWQPCKHQVLPLDCTVTLKEK